MGEWEMEFGASRPQGVGSLLREVVDERMAPRMSAAQRAAAAWYSANGDRERAHTTGVFLKRPRRAGGPPILCVYVDSHAMATDFGVNKELYLARLSNVGYEVSGIEFLPSRTPSHRTRTKDAATPQPHAPLPELTPAEADEVARLVADIPEPLRKSVSKAITLSKRRQKLGGTERER